MAFEIKTPLGALRPRGRSVIWTGGEITDMATPTREQREASRLRVEDEAPALALLLEAPPDKPPVEN